ncbi:hypothetical protein BDV23DRAFT_186473 [Aspergillus alliaceus]|uniref:Uncharacterized protein n=1 Tax=Petromyces alliaceus TaxID=209559 RepID=A0A5N7C0F4_PETAA|nr:hypothetical protein BDV23DRAFT_186473 [Aspergillus alliaceus]
MARGNRYQRHQLGPYYMEPPPELHLREGFVVGQPIPAPPYMAQGMTPGTIRLIPSPPYMATGQFSMIPPGSILAPPGFAPQTPDGRLPSSILHPQPSGYPATAWSPGPILDFYNQYDDAGVRRGNGNQPPHTLSSMQHPPPPRPTQAGCSGYYGRPVQTIPQNQAVHPTLSSHSAQSSQQNQLAQLPYLQSTQQYPYQASPVSNYPGAPSAQQQPQYCSSRECPMPEAAVSSMVSRLQDLQLRGDAPEFHPKEQRQQKTKKGNWMVVDSS